MLGKILLDIGVLLILDIILSVDNAILISMSTKQLEGRNRKLASFLGAMGAVLMRLIFVIILIFFFEMLENVKAVYILGGLLLGFIAWGMTKEHKEDEHSNVSSSTKVLKAVAIIIAADMMMSFDNALIISEVVVGMDFGNDISHAAEIGIRATMVAIALLISLVIIVFSSNALTIFMQKNKWVIYIGCWLLMSVAMEMILKDALIKDMLPGHHYMWTYFSYLVGGSITMLNWYIRGLKA